MEMLRILNAFKGYETFFITYKTEDTKELPNAYRIRRPKSLVLTMIIVFLESFRILLREKPKVLVTVGGGISIPFCFFGKLMGTKIIYIESLCRVRSKSGSGKLVYPIADLFLVQWKDMLKIYPKSKYWGSVI